MPVKIIIPWSSYKRGYTYTKVDDGGYEVGDLYVKPESNSGYLEFIPLHVAARVGDKDMVHYLLSHGADANARDIYGMSWHKDKSGGIRPLYYAVRWGGKDVAKILIDYGADVNLTGYCEETYLFAAIRARDIDMVEFLLANGANVNVTTDCYTALRIAVEVRNKDIVRLLLSQGADVNAICKHKPTTPLHTARFEYSDRDMINLLEQYGGKLHLT